jgi:assimilatory nitrate reductase catalytic subunit
MSLLAGSLAGLTEDQGEIVCSCFQVGRNQLLRAVREAGCATVNDIGEQLKAGTGCGSCVPELKRILANA